MKSFTLVAPFILLCITSARGTPLGKRADIPTQTQILQYALTLEHLESTFYSEYLAKFDEPAFENAGFEPWVRGRFKQIAQHEAAHVGLLTDALGKDAVAACTYSFPATDPKSFVMLSQILEGVGTSAYLGGAQYLSAAQSLPSPSVLTTAGSILATEARHAAWVASSASGGTPWSGPFETPLDQNQVYTLAASFITSCPSSNPTLPFTAFPALTVAENGTPVAPGKSAKVAYTDNGSGDRYLAFMSGLNTKYAKIDGNQQVTIPAGLQGTVYAVVTSSNQAVMDASTIAGPAILSFPFPASASNP
ncbi:ferritin-like domain-containing protein [Phellopilus nigrolimitatus]|nr:ferritin-like domain-containing protein [Phellopilus nigrolimitatus]